MAKSSRASSRKANNQRLKANVFGPVEAARAERLSAKLLELAAQPKPKPEEMKIADDEEGDDNKKGEHDAAAQMDVDSSATAAAAAAGEPAAQSKRASKGRVQKRKKVGSSKVVFRLYKDKKSNKRR